MSSRFNFIFAGDHLLFVGIARFSSIRNTIKEENDQGLTAYKLILVIELM